MVETKSPANAQTARCPAVSWHEIMVSDAKDPPTFLLEDNYHFLGSKPLDSARYTSPQFHADEVEKMWPNVWQFAAREEEMPDAGDFVTYENAGRSFVCIGGGNSRPARARRRICSARFTVSAGASTAPCRTFRAAGISTI